MRMFTISTIFISSGLFLIISCASIPLIQQQPGNAFDSGGTPLSTTVQVEVALPKVGLLDLATIKQTWGRTWNVNPFLPWEKSFSGIQFQVYALQIQSSSTVNVVLEEPEAFFADGTRLGRAYEKMDFLEFWLNRTDEDVEGWERKKTTIERTVPYFNSEFSLISDKIYVIPIILPKDSMPLAKITISILINGESNLFEVLP